MKQNSHSIRGRSVLLYMLLLALVCLCSAASAGVLTFPAGLQRIEDEAFYKNKALNVVELNAPLKEIGHKAFANSSVKYIYIPDSVTLIEDDAFNGCPEELEFLVPEDSYAREWCEAHGKTWHTQDYVMSIIPAAGELVMNNGATLKTAVTTVPEGAAKRLVWVSSDEKIVSVDQNGTLSANYPGSAKVVISSKDGNQTIRIRVTVRANYRAVLFSESTFGGVIQRNKGDVQIMKGMLATVTGPDGGSYKVSTFDDLVAKDVYTKITELLIKPSRDGDVSMFFFASHGDYRSTSQQYAGRLWCRNKQTWLELPTLAKELSKVKGKVIVLLESCGPGAAVHEFATNGDESEADSWFSGEVLKAFSSADPGLSVYQPQKIVANDADDRALVERYLKGKGLVSNGNLFLTEKFIVMTASDYLQASYSIGSDTYNLFPWWLVKGVGTSGAMPADVEGDNNGDLTVNELYQYVYKHNKHRQRPQVYPQNSKYVLFLRDE